MASLMGWCMRPEASYGHIIMFQPHNMVVYPAHGVGVIESIDNRCIGGSNTDFYIVRIRSSNSTLMVPVKNASVVGLRPLVSRQAALSILDRLMAETNLPVFIGQNWNRRFREYTSALKSPDLANVAKVLHELLLISRSKELSFGEKRLLEQAMSLVMGEIGEVLQCSADTLREEVLSLYTTGLAVS